MYLNEIIDLSSYSGDHTISFVYQDTNFANAPLLDDILVTTELDNFSTILTSG